MRAVVSSAARAQLRRWLPAAVVLASCAPACAPAKEPASRATVSLRLHGSPPDATVVVDDETLGSLDFVSLHGVALPPGVHHVTVEARGYFPWDREVDARPGSPPIVLDVALAKVPD